MYGTKVYFYNLKNDQNWLFLGFISDVKNLVPLFSVEEVSLFLVSNLRAKRIRNSVSNHIWPARYFFSFQKLTKLKSLDQI
jgi:hypothetical protein